MIGWLSLVVLAGAGAGTGLFLAVRELLPATPALGPTLRRLHPAPAQAAGRHPGVAPSFAWAWLARHLTIPTEDLAIRARTVDSYLVSLVIATVAGLATPLALYGFLAILGLRLPFTVPVGAALICAGLFAWLVHKDTLDKGRRARREFIGALCTYLDLVVLELGGCGPVQALERAVGICHGWVFERIADSLTRSRMQAGLPWDELTRLADSIAVVELRDVATIMRAAGTEGAAVQQTLHEHADSLRDRLRTEALEEAEAITTRLDAPGSILVLILAVFMIYPFLSRTV